MVVKNMDFDGEFKLKNGLYKNFVVKKRTYGSRVIYSVTSPDGKVQTDVQVRQVMDDFDEERITRGFAHTAVEQAKQGKLDVLNSLPLELFCNQVDEDGKPVSEDDVFLEEIGHHFGEDKTQNDAAQKLEDAYLALKKEIRENGKTMLVQQHGGVDFDVLKNDYLENAKNVSEFFDKREKEK